MAVREQRGRMNGLMRKSLIRTIGLYILFGGAWILFSDRLLEVITTPHQFAVAQTYKGWFYVLMTALLLHQLLRRDYLSIQRSQEALERRTREAEMLREAASALVSSLDLDTVLSSLLDSLARAISYRRAAVFLGEGGWMHPAAVRGEPAWMAAFRQLGHLPITARWVSEAPLAEPCPEEICLNGERDACLITAMQAHGHLVGFLVIFRPQPQEFQAEEIRLVQALAHQAASAVEHARLFRQTEMRLRFVQALHQIDLAITSSSEFQEVVSQLLKHVLEELQARAVRLFLMQGEHLVLFQGAGDGGVEGSLPPMAAGESLVERCALERRILSAVEEDGEDSQPLGLVGFAAPLVTKGQVKGALEVFMARGFVADQEWMDHLETLANQAAIAIDYHAVLTGLIRANQDLINAYDETILGWSRALDLRDRETQGHSQRVATIAVAIAREMGMPEERLTHLYRGALLHDIGKVGVPDEILFKPGPLNEAEWQVMRMHPVYAENFLSHVAFLQEALDIPCYHHERWDGSGYPKGLKGEEIPLAARIFAVADVWDALHSDRPYRPRWPEEQVAEYLRANAGRLFDPQVVEVFLRERSKILEILTREPHS
ncbi:protein containing HD-GYP domain [Anaerolinea thermolimosa]|uniref:HD domain-containing phosphohydrolase n=1 Tax=Anaerolinea thermolimosa TaxID=229919 RepID=UPI000781847C|nr:HD domain-containing phosphohydrolase [Anaerolinea thermolimosa]GAP08059.1 protein containing HD-GYP domain [Anaerolinea thermolimosa]